MKKIIKKFLRRVIDRLVQYAEPLPETEAEYSYRIWNEEKEKLLETFSDPKQIEICNEIFNKKRLDFNNIKYEIADVYEDKLWSEEKEKISGNFPFSISYSPQNGLIHLKQKEMFNKILDNMRVDFKNIRKTEYTEKDKEIGNLSPEQKITIITTLLTEIFKNFGLYDLIGIQMFDKTLDYVHVLKQKTTQTKCTTKICKEPVEIETMNFTLSATHDNLLNENIYIIARNYQFEIERTIVKILKTNKVNLLPIIKINPDLNEETQKQTIKQNIHRIIPILTRNLTKSDDKWAIISKEMYNNLSKTEYCTDGVIVDFNYTKSSIIYIGYINDQEKIKIYVDLQSPSEDIIIGCGCSDSSINVPLIFVPYKPIIMGDAFIDPNTFEPNIIFRSKFGIYSNEKHNHIIYGTLPITNYVE